jgi:hypothetical protein
MYFSTVSQRPTFEWLATCDIKTGKLTEQQDLMQQESKLVSFSLLVSYTQV